MTLPVPNQHEVQIAYAEGRLSGVLFTPPFDGQHPAVILLPGSGAADRNVSYLMPVRDHLIRPRHRGPRV
jgi:hypothetical protein